MKAHICTFVTCALSQTALYLYILVTCQYSNYNISFYLWNVIRSLDWLEGKLKLFWTSTTRSQRKSAFLCRGTLHAPYNVRAFWKCPWNCSCTCNCGKQYHEHRGSDSLLLLSIAKKAVPDPAKITDFPVTVMYLPTNPLAQLHRVPYFIYYLDTSFLQQRTLSRKLFVLILRLWNNRKLLKWKQQLNWFNCTAHRPINHFTVVLCT